ncbi:hypothetical protein P5673_028687 [Acropora cervicornis]|uniref:Uncharacterized protein n=1 Tax=Acropora cervicornis TaxID=6130 RepID=A0AAD9PXD1_ACRCE|nr:hypothetical protein P5673_028687 [Acropora cervicornis]
MNNHSKSSMYKWRRNSAIFKSLQHSDEHSNSTRTNELDELIDSLSRSPVSSPEACDTKTVCEVHVYVNEVIKPWPMSCDRIEEIKLATNQDDVMQEAIRCTIEGWPQHPKDVPRHMARVYAERSHLSVTALYPSI